jgi:thiol-disulfide isomerase/thioredoxin
MISKRVLCSTLGFVMLIVALPWGARPACAQEREAVRAPETQSQPAVTLKVGDPAPALKVEKWVKGGPIDHFEKGKVYVLEFWATWCGPCIASMPHLTALQKAFEGKATIIGMDVAEAKDYTDETLKKVEKFVKDQADRMGYSVAYDGKSRAMDTAYMEAAGQEGIPTAFLIDRTGRIVWIGHPVWLDMPLEAVVADKWDWKTGPEAVIKAQERLIAIGEKMRTAPKEAIGLWESFERDYPAAAHNQAFTKFMIFVLAGDYDKAYKVAGQLVDEALANKDANLLNEIAWTIVDPEGEVKKKDLDLALKAATQADELTKHENAAIIDTLARVYFLKGDVDKAVELETKAVAQAEGPLKDELQSALDEYKEAQAKKK